MQPSTSPASASCSPARRQASVRPRPNSSDCAVVVAAARRKDLLDAVADGSPATAAAIIRSPATSRTPSTLVEDVEKRIGESTSDQHAGRSMRRPLASRWNAGTTSEHNWLASMPAAAYPRACTQDARARGDGHYHQCRHLGCWKASPLFSRKLFAAIEGRTVGGEPNHRNRVGGGQGVIRRRCIATRWWQH